MEIHQSSSSTRWTYDTQGYGSIVHANKRQYYYKSTNTLNSTAAHQQQVLSSLGSGGSTAMMLHEACLKKVSFWA
jgi:hypothetical protein